MDNMELGSKETLSPYELVRTFESAIKNKASERFSVSPDDLALLLEDKDAAYWSQEEPDTLCCFVVNKKDGFLYLVTGKLDADRKNLEDLKTDIVS